MILAWVLWGCGAIDQPAVEAFAKAVDEAPIEGRLALALRSARTLATVPEACRDAWTDDGGEIRTGEALAAALSDCSATCLTDPAAFVRDHLEAAPHLWMSDAITLCDVRGPDRPFGVGQVELRDRMPFGPWLMLRVALDPVDAGLYGDSPARGPYEAALPRLAAALLLAGRPPDWSFRPGDDGVAVEVGPNLESLYVDGRVKVLRRELGRCAPTVQDEGPPGSWAELAVTIDAQGQARIEVATAHEVDGACLISALGPDPWPKPFDQRPSLVWVGVRYAPRTVTPPP
jgi:hypothetical protein